MSNFSMLMRELTRQMDSAYLQLSKSRPKANTIAVGAGEFDAFLRFYVLECLIKNLRNCKTIKDVIDKTETERIESIRIHNKRRPKDINWQRSEECFEQDTIMQYLPRITSCFKYRDESFTMEQC